MAGRTTAFVLVGQHVVGPFAVREWKVRHSIALIEKHRRVWMPAPSAHSLGERVPQEAVFLPEGRSVAEELIFVVATCAVRDPEFMTALRGAGLTRPLEEGFEAREWLNVEGERIESGPRIPTDLIEHAVASVNEVARLGVVRLEDDSALDDAAILWLRGRGLDVDDFRLHPMGPA